MTDWRHRAACRDHNPELWYPISDADGGPAIRICRTRCPVRQECLTWALDVGEQHGVWGGLTEAQRRLLRAPQRTRKPAATNSGPRPVDHHAEIMARWTAGETVTAIAAATKCSREAVKSYIRRQRQRAARLRERAA